MTPLEVHERAVKQGRVEAYNKMCNALKLRVARAKASGKPAIAQQLEYALNDAQALLRGELKP